MRTPLGARFLFFILNDKVAERQDPSCSARGGWGSAPAFGALQQPQRADVAQGLLRGFGGPDPVGRVPETRGAFDLIHHTYYSVQTYQKLIDSGAVPIPILTEGVTAKFQHPLFNDMMAVINQAPFILNYLDHQPRPPLNTEVNEQVEKVFAGQAKGRDQEDPEIQGLLAEIHADDGATHSFKGPYTPDKARALKAYPPPRPRPARLALRRA